MKLMYITNDPVIAQIADLSGIDWIFIDLEIIGKEERQKNLDTVISRHEVEDIRKIKCVLKNSKLLVRINPINQESFKEIDEVILMGADIIMLPFFKSWFEVKLFIDYVNGRTKTCLLIETPEAVDDLDNILAIKGIDYIHIGLNDLHLGYKLKFMFELLANGAVEHIIEKIRKYDIEYGFGGIARIGGGDLPSENIISEHVRLNSKMVILSRGFYVKNITDSLDRIKQIFNTGVIDIRNTIEKAKKLTFEELELNKKIIRKKVTQIINKDGVI